MRSEGRTVKAGEQPMKFVKLHANTVARLREIELAKDELRVAGADSAGDLMQGLYARSQTELFVPPPVVDVSNTQNLNEQSLTHGYRARYRRIILATSTYSCQVCCRRARFMSPVSNFHHRMVIEPG